MINRILFVYPEAYFTSGGGIATYLHHAVRAHLDAGRNIHILTWLTDRDALKDKPISATSILPLKPENVTLLHLDDTVILDRNRVGIWDKNISDLLYPHIKRIEAEFQPDVIEGTDYRFPLHTYLQHRMCGAHVSAVPIVTFNHGLLQNIYPASALKPSDASLREMVCERQVLAWSDHVFAPSQFALDDIVEIRGQGRGVRLVREPFWTDKWSLKSHLEGSKFIYFGRVTFAKGVDIFAGMMTAIELTWPVKQITFLGRRERTPFRRTDMQEYLDHRLHAAFKTKTNYLGPLPRSEAIAEVGNHDYFANFSRSETFSYTTLEALCQGLVPLVLARSAMAEFIPPAQRGFGTFDESPHRANRIMDVLNYWRDNYRQAMPALQEYARDLTRPDLYAANYDDLQPVAIKEANNPRYSGLDVTVLLSTYNDADLAEGAIESVLAQTQKAREILVLDDGSTIPSMCARLDRLAAQNKIRLLRVPNMGLVAGRNILVEHCETELVIFLDADDRLEPDYIEKTVRALNTAPTELSAVLTRRRNFGLNENECACFLLGTPQHWVFNDFRMTALIKRSCLTALPFDPVMRNGEADDWWWWLRFSAMGYKAVQVPEPLFRYRHANGSMSLPWSEGQGALTVSRLSEVMNEAVNAGKLTAKEASSIAKQALEIAYRRAWECDKFRAALAGDSPAVHEAILNARRTRIRAELSKFMGDRNTTRFLNFGRRLVRTNRLAARAALRAGTLLRINRPGPNVG